MIAKYSREINDAVRGTVIYRNSLEIPEKLIERGSIPTILVEPVDAVSAVLEYSKTGKAAVLNFASFRNPGGGFINGSLAQEEALCHESFLYNVLSEFRYYYDANARDTNRGLYRDSALYTPAVIFERADKITKCDVITCGAPNWRVAKDRGVTREENSRALNSRIRFILGIAVERCVKTLILGAFGCGVFAQDPWEVARIFADAIKREFAGKFERVVFAVPDARSENYAAFQNTIKEQFTDVQEV